MQWEHKRDASGATLRERPRRLASLVTARCAATLAGCMPAIVAALAGPRRAYSYHHYTFYYYYYVLVLLVLFKL